VRGFSRALEDALGVVSSMSFPIDTADRGQMLNVVQSCIGTKYTSRFGTLMAVSGVAGEQGRVGWWVGGWVGGWVGLYCEIEVAADVW
jgi:hypothetical protein